LNVSERNAEQTSGEPGSLSAGSAVPNLSDASIQPVAASGQDVPDVVSPDLVPGQSAAIEAHAPKPETSKPEASKPDASKADAPKAEAPRAEASHSPGKVMIMSAGDRNWGGDSAGPEVESELDRGMFGKRRLSALAAVVALATVAGAVGGALATASLSHFIGGEVASTSNQAIEASFARIDADILALKASVDRSSRFDIAQFNKTNDRLDKVEKAQAEPAAKLARLSEAVDKLRATPPASAVAVAAAPVAPKEVTGSIAPPAAAAPKVEVARLPTVEGWVLRDVANGGALIEGRRGMYEVYAGDPVPGLGRIDAIRRQDGRRVVVTSKGLIVAR
jgi:hypothetical protein